MCDDVQRKYTFEELCFRYDTGRSYVISGTGKNRKYGYRHGVATKIGDIERSKWIFLMKELIHRSGEDRILGALIEWESDAPWLRTRSEVEFAALSAHSYRIFDDPLWIDYIPFNRKYRPHILEGAKLVSVIPDCCITPGEITYERSQKPSFGLDGPTIPCPHCKRHTTYTLLQGTVL